MLDRAAATARRPTARHAVLAGRLLIAAASARARLLEVPAAMVELLIASAWLKPDEADDKLAISEALDSFPRSALKNFC